MALFETMRENTKLILWITVVAFVLLIFLAWGADFTGKRGGGRGGAEAGVLAKVNGERIFAQEYTDAVEQARQLYEPQLDGPPDEAFQLMLRANTWSQLVDRKLILQEARRNGIVATDREVATALLYNPPPRLRNDSAFKNEQGQFDMQRYQQWLAGTNTLALEQEYRDLVIQEKLRMQVLAGVTLAQDDVRQAWLERNQSANLAYVMIPFADAYPGNNVDDATLETYLREHAADFRLPARVRMEYVRIEKRATAEDTLDARSEINEAYQEFRRGEDFALVVRSYSQAPQSHWGEENAPYLTREEIQPPAVAEAAFALPVGQVSDVLSSSDGLHLIKVMDRKTEAGVDKVKLAEIFVPLKMSYDTNFALQEKALDLVDSTGVRDFAAAATDLGLQVNDSGFFVPGGFIPGLGNLAAAKEFARTAHPTQTSRPIEGPDAWYVLFMAGGEPARDAQLSDVRMRVQLAYLQGERERAAVERARAILDLARGGTPLEAAAASDAIARYGRADGVTAQGIVRGLGREPKLAGAAFAAGTAGLVPRVISGTAGAFVIDVLAPPVVDDQAFESQKNELRTQLLQERQNRTLNEWMSRLREGARIEDFRPVLSSM
jgi:parvulin-like peptidyl-prolyl isomerase